METREIELVFEEPVPSLERFHLLPFLGAMGYGGNLPRDLRGFRLRLPRVPRGGTVPFVEAEGTMECVLPPDLMKSGAWSMRVERVAWGCHWHINGRPFLSRLDFGPFPPTEIPEQVVNLILAGFFSFPDGVQLPGFLAGLPRLASLMIHRFEYLEDLRILPYCRSLRHLTLLTDRLASLRVLGAMESLRTLRLVSCCLLNGLEGLQTQEGLERLEILHCQGVVDLSPLANLNDLRHLVLLDCGVKDLSPLAGNEALETLVLTDLPRLEKLAPMGPKPRLRELSIHHCPKLANLRCLRELSGLRHCSLHGFTGKRVQPVFALAGLVSLDLSRCILEDQHLLPLLRIPGLESLALTGVEDVQHLYHVEGLLNLRRLEIQGCFNLTTLRFLRYLSRLEVLDLTMCLQVPSLKVLGGLGGIRRLGVSAVNPGAMNPEFLSVMPELEDLRMSGWYRLQHLGCLRRNTRLEFLDIRGCHGLSSLAHLASLPEKTNILCDGAHQALLQGGVAHRLAFSQNAPNSFHPMVLRRTLVGEQTRCPQCPDPRIDLGQYHFIQEGVKAFIERARKATSQGAEMTANQNSTREMPR